MKKKTKSKGVSFIIPAPHAAESVKTERTAVALLMHWMREIIEDKQLELGLPDVETISADRKMPDLVIYESPRSQQVLCVMEAKLPYYDAFDETSLKNSARQKATNRKARYFVLTNFKQLVWFNTENVNAMKPEEEQIIGSFDLSSIENLEDIENTLFKNTIKEGLEDFLSRLYNVHTGKEAEPKLPIDELLIARIHEKIRILAFYYKDIIRDKCHKQSEFAAQLKTWFKDQGWSFAWQMNDFYKAARQTAYLLVNKILFYNLLQTKRLADLDPLEIPVSLTRGALLQNQLQGYFAEVLKIDYETIYTTDFIDEIAYPEDKRVITEIKKLIDILRRYDFSILGYDIIGRIFEQLIPKDERHNLGQYFTNADVVDLILKFSSCHEDETVLDPSCGAGTFLVRAYQHKKMMNMRKKHEDILGTLWGNDIAKFPAHLATINLAINNLASDKNYPNILREDFFKFIVGNDGFIPEKWRKSRAKTLGLEEREVIYPRWFDVIVGNPPYTRQEEIGKISPEDKEYKEKTIESALFSHESGASIGKRAGIYAYFFIHGTKFLKEGGHFGFIVPNSWLDVDYGKGLQEFFLDNYKIIAIIESRVERWFEDADVNTSIVILQKCKEETTRDKNIVRFVHLKKPLRYFIPPAQDIWEKQLDRLNEIDKLQKTIMAHKDFYENDELRIFPRLQEDLREEGYDPDAKKYIGAKWGKYLRAPEIYFEILEKTKDKLTPLKEVASVRRGFTTGVNEFFYLTQEEIERWGIEKEFWMRRDKDGEWIPNKIIVSPKEGKNVVLDPEMINNILIFIHKEKNKLKKKKVLSYIKHGENKGFDERKTCRARKLWYSINYRKPWPILHPMIHHDRQTILLNRSRVQVDHNLFEIKPRKGYPCIPLLCFLLSTVSMLIKEVLGRSNLGEGALKTEGIDVQRLLVPRNFSRETKQSILNLVRKYPDASINSIFDDLTGGESGEITLDNIRPERRELDRIIMGEVLGLTETEQLEVYRAVIDMVKSRIDKAKSVESKSKIADGVDIDILTGTVVNYIDEKEGVT